MPYAMENIALYPQHRARPRGPPATIEDLVAHGQGAARRPARSSEILACRWARPATPTTSTRCSPPPAATCSAPPRTATSTPNDLGHREARVRSPRSRRSRRSGEKGEGALKRSITSENALEPLHRADRRAVPGLRAVAADRPARQAGIDVRHLAGPRVRGWRAGLPVPHRASRSTWPARARTRRSRQEFVTNFWSRAGRPARATSRPAQRRAGAPPPSSTQIQDRTPTSWRWSRGRRQNGQIMPSDPGDGGRLGPARQGRGGGHRRRRPASPPSRRPRPRSKRPIGGSE